MSKNWVAFLMLAVLNIFLSIADYLSAIGASVILFIAMLLVTVGMGIKLANESEWRMKTVFLILLVLAVSHFKATGMIFVLIVWKYRGFGG